MAEPIAETAINTPKQLQSDNIMAGQFAHICLVNSVATPELLNSIPELEPSVAAALGDKYLPYCRLGAVSPDCPAFVRSTDASGWNDLMHYLRPADFVRAGIEKMLGESFSLSTTRACIAWLFGYTAHIVADCTIHPVVGELVGPYSKKTQKAHGRCEFDQDSHIFFKLMEKEIDSTDFLDFTGMARCGVKMNTHHLDPCIVDLWRSCLEKYPRSDTKRYVRLPKVSLDPEQWFATYINGMENLLTKNSPITRFAGLEYLDHDKVDSKNIKDLPTPKPGKVISCDALFEMSKRNILAAWAQMAQAFHQEEPQMFKLPNANLDTGKDANGVSLYWS